MHTGLRVYANGGETLYNELTIKGTRQWKNPEGRGVVLLLTADQQYARQGITSNSNMVPLFGKLYSLDSVVSSFYLAPESELPTCLGTCLGGQPGDVFSSTRYQVRFAVGFLSIYTKQHA